MGKIMKRNSLYLVIFLCIALFGIGSARLLGNGSNNVSVTLTSVFDNENSIASTTVQRAFGSKFQQIAPEHRDYAFAFWIVNGIVRMELPETHWFTVTSQMDLVAVYYKTAPLTHTVLFMDTNGRLLDKQFVLDGQNAIDPSNRGGTSITLPTKPGYAVSETKWKTLDHITSLVGITTSRVYVLQYEKTSIETFDLVVVDGVGSATYAFNEIVTITPNAAPEGLVFSHWVEDGEIVSTKEEYSFTMLQDHTLQAVYLEEKIADTPLVRMSHDIGLRASHRSYLGQFYVPQGYELVEVGFILSETGVVGDHNSAGVIQVESNKYFGPTGEFLMSLPEHSHKGIRAFLCVRNTNNENALEYYYSVNNPTYVSITLEYQGADGNNTVETFTVLYGTTYSELPTPTKTDYAFAGWATSEFDAIESTSIVETVANHTLTAHWYTPGLSFTLVSGAYEVSKGGITASHVEVPAVYLGQKVASVAANGFYDYTPLVSINLPETITRIGNSAFWRCNNLVAIDLPESVRDIGSNAFQNCSSLVSIVIPEGVTSLLASTFHSCTSMTSITLPSTLTSIGNGVFGNVASLGSLTIPSKVTSIGTYAFFEITTAIEFASGSELTVLGDYSFFGYRGTSLTIPTGVTTLGRSSLSSMPFLTSLTLPSTLTTIEMEALQFNNWYTQYKNAQPDGIIYVATVAHEYKGVMEAGTTLILASGTKGISYRAFANNSNIIGISFPSSLVAIGEGAFQSNNNLTSISLPSNLKVIGKSAFSSCNSLTNVTIPASVEVIGDSAFSGCAKLQQVYFSHTTGNLPTFGTTVFQASNNNFKIYVPDGSENAYKNAPVFGNTFGWAVYSEDIIDNNGYAIHGTTLVQYVGSSSTVDIPEGVTTIGYAALQETSIASVTLPTSLVTIGDNAFQNNPNLTTITIPESVTAIGGNAFYYCTSLQTVNIERSVSDGITTGGVNMFAHTHENLIIRVPDNDSVAAYQGATHWSTYADKIEFVE